MFTLSRAALKLKSPSFCRTYAITENLGLVYAHARDLNDGESVCNNDGSCLSHCSPPQASGGLIRRTNQAPPILISFRLGGMNSGAAEAYSALLALKIGLHYGDSEMKLLLGSLGVVRNIEKILRGEKVKTQRSTNHVLHEAYKAIEDFHYRQRSKLNFSCFWLPRKENLIAHELAQHGHKLKLVIPHPPPHALDSVVASVRCDFICKVVSLDDLPQEVSEALDEEKNKGMLVPNVKDELGVDCQWRRES